MSHDLGRVACGRRARGSRPPNGIEQSRNRAGRAPLRSIRPMHKTLRPTFYGRCHTTGTGFCNDLRYLWAWTSSETPRFSRRKKIREQHHHRPCGHRGDRCDRRRVPAQAGRADRRRSTVWTGAVKRGAMVREVRGAGTLVPEDIRWIPATTTGRVEEIVLRPAPVVKPGTVILELSNPDLKQQANDAELGMEGRRSPSSRTSKPACRRRCCSSRTPWPTPSRR